MTVDSVSVLVGRIFSPIGALLAGCSAAEFRQDLTRGQDSADPQAVVVRNVTMAMGWTGAFLAIVAVLFAAVPLVDHGVIAPVPAWFVRLSLLPILPGVLRAFAAASMNSPSTRVLSWGLKLSKAADLAGVAAAVVILGTATW